MIKTLLSYLLTDVDSAALRWRTSSASSSGSNAQCVQVAMNDRAVFIRDSKGHSGAILAFQSTAWTAFLKGGI